MLKFDSLIKQLVVVVKFASFGGEIKPTFFFFSFFFFSFSFFFFSFFLSSSSSDELKSWDK